LGSAPGNQTNRPNFIGINSAGGIGVHTAGGQGGAILPFNNSHLSFSAYANSSDGNQQRGLYYDNIPSVRPFNHDSSFSSGLGGQNNVSLD
jgi:hypothetical protein